MAWVLDSEIHSRAVSEFFANTIALASNRAPAKWGLTEYPDGGLRLNVGFSKGRSHHERHWLYGV